MQIDYVPLLRSDNVFEVHEKESERDRGRDGEEGERGLDLCNIGAEHVWSHVDLSDKLWIHRHAETIVQLSPTP